MKQEEYDILGLKKRAEGKSSKQIIKEINDINNFGKQLKVNKKTIAKQDKQIIKLKREIEKQNKIIFNLKLEINSKEDNKGNTIKSITLNDLKKITSIVKVESGLEKKEIAEACGITNKKINCALTYLLRNNMIEEKTKNGMKYYK
jgi:hypothetical protein